MVETQADMEKRGHADGAQALVSRGSVSASLVQIGNGLSTNRRQPFDLFDAGLIRGGLFFLARPHGFSGTMGG
jgi:hypothetical protein